MDQSERPETARPHALATSRGSVNHRKSVVSDDNDDDFSGQSIAVVLPAYNEETLILETIASLPAFVNRIYVVDDASQDKTCERVRAAMQKDGRISLICHRKNRGVGAAVARGYKAALDEEQDVVCVMDADGQMDPHDLAKIVRPVARGELEYAKANRLFTDDAWETIPHYRYLGNAVLSLLTKIASGYWHIADSQSGYTAISRAALERLNLDSVYPSYGYPNDMLVRLNVIGARVRNIPSRPVYGVGEHSNIRLHRVIPCISWLLFKGFFRRLFHKYVILDFHPLVFFYAFGLFCTLTGVILGILKIFAQSYMDVASPNITVIIALALISGTQFTLFAMWFDMESNRDLR